MPRKKAIVPQEKEQKNANGEGSVFQRQTGKYAGKWFAQITIGKYANGRPKPKTVMCDTEIQGNRELGKLLVLKEKFEKEERERQRQKEEEPEKGEPIKVVDWFRTFMDVYRKPELSENTWASNNSLVSKNVPLIFGEQTLDEADTEKIQKRYNVMTETLETSSMELLHKFIKMGFKQAVESGKTKNNPMNGVKVPKKESVTDLDDDESKAMTEAETDTFIRAIDICHNKLGIQPILCIYYLTLLGTGLRKGEGLGISLDKIDFKSGTVTVLRQVIRIRKRGLVVKRLKNQQSRRLLPLPHYVLVALRLLKIYQYKMKKAQKSQGGSYSNKYNLIFTKNNGEPLDPDFVYTKFKSICKRIGISEDLTVHSLRHTFATRLLEQGESIQTVSKLLGHKDIRTTSRIYAHVTPKLKTEAATKMNKLMNNALKKQTDKAV